MVYFEQRLCELLSFGNISKVYELIQIEETRMSKSYFRFLIFSRNQERSGDVSKFQLGNRNPKLANRIAEVGETDFKFTEKMVTVHFITFEVHFSQFATPAEVLG